MNQYYCYYYQLLEEQPPHDWDGQSDTGSFVAVLLVALALFVLYALINRGKIQ